jgi:hypothetical protein
MTTIVPNSKLGTDVPQCLTLQGGYLYFTTQDSAAGGGGGKVRKVAITGVNATPTLVAQNQMKATKIDGDATNVYWLNDSQVLMASKSAAVPVTPTVLEGGQDAPSGLATAGGYVYWTNKGSGEVMAVAGATSPHIVSLLAEGQSQPGAVAVKDGVVYWLNDGNGKVSKVPAM